MRPRPMVAMTALLGWVLASPAESSPITVLDDIDRQFFIERGGDWLFNEGVGSRPTFSLAVLANRSSGPADPPWASRGAVEFDTSAAPNYHAWKNVILRFQTSSHMFTPVLQIHGFIGDGVVRRSDVLPDDPLEELTITAAFNDIETWNLDVTEWARSTAMASNYLGFSFRIKDDTTDTIDQDVFVFAPTPGYDGSGHYKATGPQLLIDVANVPLPSSLALFVSGLAGMGYRLRHRLKGAI